jgi:RND family efflux transporter MFP subunit
LRPGITVQTAPALLLEQSATATGTPSQTQTLSQASGWIEPDPYPIRVPARVDGIVETVNVLAGESVQKDQLLATLDPTDFAYTLQALEGALQSAKAQQHEKEQAVKRAQAESRRAEAGLDAAKARLNEQEGRLRRVLALDAGVLPEDERLQIEREVAVGRADRAAAEAEWQGHQAHQAVEEAGVKTAKAHLIEREAKVAQARINLDRTEIRAPIDGVVLMRFATPGGKRMRGMDDPDSATVVSLYHPEKLQVRVDVPLADAAQILPGMPARIRLSAFPDREFNGEVTRIVGEADLIRNTLQVKVRIDDPDSRMRPEMLCRVEFLSLPTPGSTATDHFRPSETVWIPEAAIQADGTIWVVDALSQKAAPRELTLSSERRDGYAAVQKGLRPGERVILGTPAGLKTGVRVNAQTGESK